MECFNARRWRIGGTEGEGGTSNVVRFIKSEVFVLRLSKLGFRFMPGIVGLMKDGEEGSETREEARELKDGWMESPFMFLDLRGAGEVMGRCLRLGSDTERLAMRDKSLVKGCVGAAKVERGSRFTGESGEDDGEGSERSEESVHDTVVVGEDSADSVARLDALL